MKHQSEAATAEWERIHQFDAVLEQSVAGVYLLSDRGEVLYVNAGFAQLSGRAPADVIGHGFLEFVANSDHELVTRTFNAALDAQQRPIEVHLRTTAGELLTVLSQAAPAHVQGHRA